MFRGSLGFREMGEEYDEVRASWMIIAAVFESFFEYASLTL
jgi:hypothetical protein